MSFQSGKINRETVLHFRGEVLAAPVVPSKPLASSVSAGFMTRALSSLTSPARAAPSPKAPAEIATANAIPKIFLIAVLPLAASETGLGSATRILRSELRLADGLIIG